MILGIGLPRTGTYSLTVALNYLGYKTKHYPKTIESLKEYDAACEVRFPITELENMYPNSKYIVTVRDIDDWLWSCTAHFKNYKKGWNPFWLENWTEHYRNKQKSLKFFATRTDKILILNIIEGEGWNKICHFLNKKVPNIPFPKTNRSINSHQKLLSQKNLKSS